MRAKRRLTAPEFDAVRPLMNISDDRLNAARMALVDGMTMQGVASVYSWSRQAVSDAVMAVWRQYERYQESQRAMDNAGMVLPPGWEKVTLIAPVAIIERVRSEIAAAAAGLGPSEAAVTAKKPAAKRK